jgi:hypothetical protein
MRSTHHSLFFCLTHLVPRIVTALVDSGIPLLLCFGAILVHYAEIVKALNPTQVLELIFSYTFVSNQGWMIAEQKWVIILEKDKEQ